MSAFSTVLSRKVSMKLKKVYFYPDAFSVNNPALFSIWRCNFFIIVVVAARNICNSSAGGNCAMRWSPSHAGRIKVSILAAVWKKNNQKVVLLSNILPAPVDWRISDIATFFYRRSVWVCCGNSGKIGIITAGIQTNLLIRQLTINPLMLRTFVE